MSRAKSNERKYTSARKRAEKQGTGYSASYLRMPDGLTEFKPKSGTMLLDILPYVAGKGNEWADEGLLHWERTFNIHRGVGANGDSYICPRLTTKEPCPICEFRSSLVKKGDDKDEELIRDLAPKQRQLFIVKNVKDPDKGFQLWSISYYLFGKVLDARLRNSDEEDEWEKFFHTEDGLTLKVGFAEKSFAGANFLEAETIDFKSRRTAYEESDLEDLPCLDDLLIVPSYKELKDVFLEAKPKKKEEAKDDDEDDDDEPVKSSKKKAKPSAKDDDDDDDDDEEPVKPTKKKAKPSAKDDWDDFDDDEDEEEKSSKKKAKPSAKDDEEEEEDEDDIPMKYSKKKSAVKEDEEDEEDGGEGEEEEEEEEEKKTPKLKGRHTKFPPDEEEDEEEDEDEEEAPKKTPKKKMRRG